MENEHSVTPSRHTYPQVNFQSHHRSSIPDVANLTVSNTDLDHSRPLQCYSPLSQTSPSAQPPQWLTSALHAIPQSTTTVQPDLLANSHPERLSPLYNNSLLLVSHNQNNNSRPPKRSPFSSPSALPRKRQNMSRARSRPGISQLQQHNRKDPYTLLDPDLDESWTTLSGRKNVRPVVSAYVITPC